MDNVTWQYYQENGSDKVCFKAKRLWDANPAKIVFFKLLGSDFYY